jgi:hypothetical protein
LVTWRSWSEKSIWLPSSDDSQATCAVLVTAFAQVLTVDQMIDKLSLA